MTAKVMIIEDEAIIAKDLQLLAEKGAFEVVSVVSTCQDAITQFRKMSPDLVISDIYLDGDKSGIDAVDEILKTKSVPVIFVTAFSNDELIEQVSHLNNVFYLTKPFTNAQVQATLKLAASKIPNETLPKVSRREKQIVDLMVHGRSSCEIAAALNISVETVKTHRKHIFSKYQVNSATQLVGKILHYGGCY